MAQKVFIRNDDVGELTPALVAYVERFLRAGLPVSYQVIPLKLTPKCARWLNQLREQNPHLIEFGQHGLCHEMTVRGRHLWREFGPERSAAAQRADIVRGKAIVEDALGPITLFTPPQHKYDRNTLRASHDAGHRIFSAAHYAPLPYQLAYAAGCALGWSSFRHHGLSRHGCLRDDVPLAEVSISIAIDNGGVATTPPATLARKLHGAVTSTQPVGVMTHHEVYATQPAVLDMIIDALRSAQPAEFALLTEIGEAIIAPTHSAGRSV